MPDSPDTHPQRRHRSPSGSPAPPRDRRDRRDRERERERFRDSSRDNKSHRHDSHRSSRRDSSRRREQRRSSRSPNDREQSRRDDDSHRRRERRERATSPRDERDHDRDRDRDRDRHRRRHRDYDDEDSSHRSSHRRRRDRDTSKDRTKPPSSSRRHRDSPSRSRSRSRSPHTTTAAPSAPIRSSKPLPSQQTAYTTDLTPSDSQAPAAEVEKEKPNFGTTGRLAAESNTVTVHGGGGGNGPTTVVLKYHEPPEARKPPAKDSWRLYVFKGRDLLEMVELNVRSCWLVGREHLVVDFPLEHPSCSKQHAAIQFRFVEKKNEYGDRIGRVKPYVIDLESANGTTVNGDRIPAGRFVEIMDKDVLRFGLSSREYVLMLTKPE
ncbi:putative FHA domain protein SNIP1 [Aspergillus brunneoviolaceus CBS 621.78]|uniref:SMAD/FHA domain-containing protein n=1 Tax=Aspergillus brunneoviolaceus CBS 621.78 TaxID=1450534 RepID=A0ACD1GBP2_9EURO|nr:SMAD/FHA domain-containing protein [Aspergillus brunneoviolaceus CBS 621.78]RAH46709.1 SMAD/FHA domain-containing protein [Aspergillus brunneoviolaceus CBS 621.78]